MLARHAIDGVEVPLRAAVETSLRRRPFTTASMRIGVCAESQSCMSWGEVYQAILPVSTFTATSELVKKVPFAAALGERRVGFPVPKIYSLVSGS